MSSSASVRHFKQKAIQIIQGSETEGYTVYTYTQNIREIRQKAKHLDNFSSSCKFGFLELFFIY